MPTAAALAPPSAHVVLPPPRTGAPPPRAGVSARRTVAPPPRAACRPSAGSPRPCPGSSPARVRFVDLSSERGQASAELVALLPLLALVLAVAWQGLLAGDALWRARAAARAAARAQAVGADPRAAARAHLPPRLERGLRVHGESGGDVRVSIRIPAIVEALDLGRVDATAHFDPQDA